MFEIAAPEFGKVLLVDVENSKYLQKMWEQKQFGNNWEIEKLNLSVELVEPDPFLEKLDQKQSLLQKQNWQYKMNVSQSHFRYEAFTNSSLEIFDKFSVLETIMSSSTHEV